MYIAAAWNRQAHGITQRKEGGGVGIVHWNVVLVAVDICELYCLLYACKNYTWLSK